MILAEVSNGPTVMILALFTMVIPLWAVIDALTRPAVAFYAAGSNKTAWVIVLLVATFVLGIGLFLAAYYLIAVRRKVRQQMQPR
jgi:uncharacterized membrane-anchored protein